jgi:hypothetical protein
MKRNHTLSWRVEELERRRLLSFDPLLAGGIAQNAEHFPYIWNSGFFGSDSLLLQNERLGNEIMTGSNYALPNPNPAMTDKPILDNARFLLRGTTQAIGTLTVRNSQASGDIGESYWNANYQFFDRVHDDGFFLSNTASGTNSVIVFDNVDSANIEAYQSFILDYGSAREIIFRNCTWNEKCSLKVRPDCTIGEIVFDHCKGTADILQMGGALGAVYNNDPDNCFINGATAINGLPQDLAQPAPYAASGATPISATGSNIIEAENFDTQGEGVSYHDASSEDASTQAYRRSFTNGPDTGVFPRVDLTPGGSNGWSVGSIQAGEWIDYTINVQQPGMYRLDSMLKSDGNGGQWRVSIGGRNLSFLGQTGAFAPLPNTGGSFSLLPSQPIFLAAGQQTLTVQFSHTSSATADIGQVDCFSLAKVADADAPPAIPAGLRLGNSAGDTNQGTRETMSIAWQGVDGAVGYDVARDDGSGNWKVIGQIAGGAQDWSGAITDFTDPNLQPSTSYSYRVRSFNSAGHSDWSSPLAVTTKPAPVRVSRPTDVYVRQEAATVDSKGNPVGNVSFHWTPTSTNERAFKIDRWASWGGFDTIWGAGAGTTSTLFSGPATGDANEDLMNRFDTVYKIRVAAVNVEGRAYSPTIFLPADAGFESGLISSGWTVTAGAAVAGPGGNTGKEAALLSAGSRIEQTLTNLTPDTTYTLRAFAHGDGLAGVVTLGVNGYGQTAMSSATYQRGEVTFTTGADGSATIYASVDGGIGFVDDFEVVEDQPSDPVLAPAVVTDHTITLNWTINNPQNLDGFELWRSTDGVNWIDVTSPNRISPNVHTFTDNQSLLRSSTTFQYQIRAAQKGDPYSTTGFYYGQPNYSNVVTGVVTHAPATPTNLRATSVMPKLVELRWDDATPYNDEWGFEISRSLDGVSYQVIASTPANVTRFMDSGVPDQLAQSGVYYRVRAFTPQATSDATVTFVQSSTGNPNPDPNPDPGTIDPNAPTNLRVTDGTSSEIDLAWDGWTESNFIVERSNDAKSWTMIGAPQQPFYSDTTVSPSAGLYYYRVRTIQNGVTTGPSASIVRRAQSLFGQSRILSLPNKVEAEAFDLGGEGVAYHGSPTPLPGALHRTGIPDASPGLDSGIDLGSDGAKTWVVGQSGEWMEYTLSVPRDAVYNLDFSVASAGPGGGFHAEIDGQWVGNSLQVPDTGAANAFTTLTDPGIPLIAGTHVLRLAMDWASWPGSIVASFDSIALVETESLNSGILRLRGGSGDESFFVRVQGDQVQVDRGGAVSWTTHFYPASQVTGIDLDGGGGNDQLFLDFTGQRVTVTQAANLAGVNINGGQIIISPDLGAGQTGPGPSMQLTGDSHVTFASTQHLSALDIAPSATASLAGGRDKALVLNSLSLEQGVGQNASLDLVDNALILNYSGASPLASIQQLVRNGLANPKLNPGLGGLLSSDSANPKLSKSARALAVFDNHDAKFTKLEGVGLEGFDQVLVKYTYLGDANMDGRVDPTDYAMVDGNQGKGTSWVTGDLNFDGKVDPTDYAQVDGNQGAGFGGPAGPRL